MISKIEPSQIEWITNGERASALNINRPLKQFITKYNVTIESALSGKVDKVSGKGLSDENYTQVEKTKLAGIAAGATKNATDAQLRDRATHTGMQPISTITGLDAAILSKVDKVAGKGLSTNDLTDPLYDKLVGLEGTHWRGTFPSLSALQSGVTEPQAGDYADVDVAGEDVQRYIWDATDSVWVVQSGAVAPITASQAKMLYESNPDTNAFTDADVITLNGIQPQIDDINLLIGDIGSALDTINGEVI